MNCTIGMKMFTLGFRINNEMPMIHGVFRCKNFPTVRKYFIPFSLALRKFYCVFRVKVIGTNYRCTSCYSRSSEKEQKILGELSSYRGKRRKL